MEIREEKKKRKNRKDNQKQKTRKTCIPRLLTQWMSLYLPNALETSLYLEGRVCRSRGWEAPPRSQSPVLLVTRSTWQQPTEVSLTLAWSLSCIHEGTCTRGCGHFSYLKEKKNSHLFNSVCLQCWEESWGSGSTENVLGAVQRREKETSESDRENIPWGSSKTRRRKWPVSGRKGGYQWKGK